MVGYVTVPGDGCELDGNKEDGISYFWTFKSLTEYENIFFMEVFRGSKFGNTAQPLMIARNSEYDSGRTTENFWEIYFQCQTTPIEKITVEQ